MLALMVPVAFGALTVSFPSPAFSVTEAAEAPAVTLSLPAPRTMLSAPVAAANELMVSLSAPRTIDDVVAAIASIVTAREEAVASMFSIPNTFRLLFRPLLVSVISVSVSWLPALLKLNLAATADESSTKVSTPPPPRICATVSR